MAGSGWMRKAEDRVSSGNRPLRIRRWMPRNWRGECCDSAAAAPPPVTAPSPRRQVALTQLASHTHTHTECIHPKRSEFKTRVQ
ncbi:unnamed protein product [Plutella xylostella]|uniref:(diamondback moth) hypothetical protein n=1 Tax=Plutella xylostella TaxID=51655 RepID=A0A8S4D107_PLUXY|nr:unnamed protein product [Plutella xylostella]